MIERNITPWIQEAASHYPVVTLTGPRQAGKTTLCQQSFPDKAYVSLERLDVQAHARSDPLGFLEEHASGAILDEVQHVPELLSYLQVEVDREPAHGRFVLTGSQHFGLSAAIAQTLAGRTAVLQLMPPSLDELMRFEAPPQDLWTTLWTGAYPRIHDRKIPAERWLADYLVTYVQRDVRQVLRVGDLNAFTDFVRLCAGRSAQLRHLEGLGADAGVSHNTAKAWLGVLETSYLIFSVPAWHRSARRQLTRAPKLHFLDSGLLCHLLGVGAPEQLRHHPLRGAVFESWVAAEIFKAHTNAGRQPLLRHYRDARGLEVDLLVGHDAAPTLVEVKSGATLGSDFFGALEQLARRLEDQDLVERVARVLVYGGEEATRRGEARVVPWRAVASQPWLEPR